MTDEMVNLRSLVEKTPDADVRDMIAFAAERLMEIEVGTLTGASHGEKRDAAGAAQRLSQPRFERPEPAPSSCASPGCARAATSPASSSRAAWPRSSRILRRGPQLGELASD